MSQHAMLVGLTLPFVAIHGNADGWNEWDWACTAVAALGGCPREAGCGVRRHARKHKKTGAEGLELVGLGTHYKHLHHRVATPPHRSQVPTLVHTHVGGMGGATLLPPWPIHPGGE